MRAPLTFLALVAACQGSGTQAATSPASDAGPITVGPLITFDEVALGPADGMQEQPGAAWTGSAFLVSWIDDQLGVRADHVDPATGQPSGQPIALGPKGNLRNALAACTTSGACAVAWSSLEASASTIYIRRAGVDAAPIPVGQGVWQDLAATGAGFFAVWYADDQHVRGALLGPSGSSIPVDVFPAADFTDRPRVGCDGSVCLVEVGGRLARVTTDGTVTPPGAAVLAGGSGDVGCTAGTCLVALVDSRGGIAGKRVDVTGTPIDASPIPIFSPGSGTIQAQFGDPRVVFDGKDFVLASQLSVQGTFPSRVVAKRVSPLDGSVSPSLPFDLIPSIDQQSRPAVACGAGTCLVAATVYGATADIAAARFVGTTLEDAPPIIVTVSADRQWLPSAASDGSGYLVAWTSQRSDGASIRAARLGGDRTWTDRTSILVGTATDAQSYSAVAWTGSSWLVVWTDRDGLHGARPGDPPISYSTTSRASMPSIACRDGRCAIAYLDGNDEAAILVGAAGAPTGPAVDLGLAGDAWQGSALAWVGDTWVIGWTSQLDATRGDQIVAKRLRPDGTVVDGEPVFLQVKDGRVAWGSPRAATVGDGILFAWGGQWSNTEDVWDVGVRAIGPDLAPRGDPVPLAATSLVESFPQVAPVGATALVVWHENDLGSLSRYVARRVSGSGTVLGAASTLVADVDPSTGQVPGSLAAGAAGQAILVYGDFDPKAAATRLRVVPISAP